GGGGWIPPDPDCGEASFSGGGTKTNVTGNCDPGWVPGGSSPSANQTIIDSLQGYPCAQGILAQLPGVNAAAKTILQNVFGVNNKVNVIFKADSTLPPTHNGFVDTVIFNATTGRYDAIVILNGKVLRKASKEFIAKTMFHESIHAYISYYWKQYKNGIIDSTTLKNMFPKIWQYKSASQIAQHTEIANFYINHIKSIISSFNPSIADSTNIAIAWGGLSETIAWKNLGSDTIQLNRLRSVSRDSSAARMQSVNLTKCN
ncbi:MAG: hypothetical protein ABL876_12515, partial [Chitinophagaceae bacterium]